MPTLISTIFLDAYGTPRLAAAPAQQQAAKAAQAGEQMAGSNYYSYDARVGVFGPQTNKCNLAVADWIEAAGIPRPRVKRGGLLGRLGFTRDLTAAEWATAAIPGWSAPDSVENAQVGDVMAMAHKDGGGHVGIYIGSGLSVSADALLSPAGQVAITNWGSRPSPGNGENQGDGDRVVVRHYLGGGQ